MITIENAKVETLDMNQARPVGKTVLAVTIGDHTFQMLVDEIELIAALSSDIVKITEGREEPVFPCRLGGGFSRLPFFVLPDLQKSKI